MNLKFERFIFSVVCASLVFLFSFPKIDAGPVSSDDYQYWYIATHLAKTGEYGFLDQVNNDIEDYANPLNNSGIRRGESLYPFIISSLIKLITTKNELMSINSDCIYGINDGLWYPALWKKITTFDFTLNNHRVCSTRGSSRNWYSSPVSVFG